MLTGPNMQVYSIDGIVPVIHPAAFVHPSAVLIGDVIVAVEGKEVANRLDLFDRLQDHAIGDTVVVTVLRDDERVDLEVTLQAVGQ